MEKDDLASKVLGLRWKQYSVSFLVFLKGGVYPMTQKTKKAFLVSW